MLINRKWEVLQLDRLPRNMKYLKHIKQFFSGFIWPLQWLETEAKSAGLLTALFLFIIIATSASFIGFSLIIATISDETASDTSYSDVASALPSYGSDIGNDSSCNVLAIAIRDCILTYKPDTTDSSSLSDSCDVITSSEEVMNAIENAKGDDEIKAVLLEIDSTGGMPVAAEEIGDAMKGLGKPSVAWVRGGAVSAAYWIASSADTIVAAENSDVGGIGITQSYVDNAKQNQTEGLTYNQLSTGLYKDTGSSDKPLTTAERLYLERDLNIMLDNFIRAVATNRNLSIEKVRALADGSSMLGAMALKNGLIDKLGTKQQVWDELEKQIGEKPEVCW